MLTRHKVKISTHSKILYWSLKFSKLLILYRINKTFFSLTNTHLYFLRGWICKFEASIIGNSMTPRRRNKHLVGVRLRCKMLERSDYLNNIYRDEGFKLFLKVETYLINLETVFMIMEFCFILVNLHGSKNGQDTKVRIKS